jgi:hypothetical protein
MEGKRYPTALRNALHAAKSRSRRSAEFVFKENCQLMTDNDLSRPGMSTVVYRFQL